ncbi:DUF418 domain-containing protein [Geomicrobium sediminis]|uniref:DUF418 domain-containing protein n=1 Tax=Geomicrobium sediminis TaxID=1347788 RepID=A0ABS2PF11_9BACL|nr:DUF418 domain-containing protein [Geomicrobium sediminis]MBM7633998.1 uncharacterized protein [Geomicrobium sediminis]
MATLKNGARGQRIEILDQMRGIALLAIFLVNISGLASVATEDQTPLNEFVKDVLSILLGDSARPLFAFMFGISLILIYERLQAKGFNPHPTLLRRLLLLFFVGAIHGYYIWAGDILLMYAMAGFVLLLFMKLPEKWLLMLALVFWLGMAVGMDVLNSFTSYNLDLEEWLKNLLGPAKSLTGTEYLIIEFSSMVNHLGFFLFGMYVYKKKLFSLVAERRKLMWFIAFIFITVGLVGKIGFYYEVDTFLLNNMYNFYSFVVTIGAIISIILWDTSRSMITNSLLLFSAVGKMTFTNYLMQSLIFVSLFTQSGRSIFEGVGIWAEPSYIFALSVGVLLFAVQMIFSYLWLKKFYYGPFEWLWRIGTYGRKIPLRKMY